MKRKYQREAQIQNQIMREFATRPDMRLWRANVLAARMHGRLVRAGVPGQADLSGILADGRRLEIEVKSETGRLSEDQKRFGEMITRFGGVYIIVAIGEDVRYASQLTESIYDEQKAKLNACNTPTAGGGTREKIQQRNLRAILPMIFAAESYFLAAYVEHSYSVGRAT